MELRTVESLCDAVYSGGTPSRKKPEYYEGGTIPWIKTMEIRDGYIYDSEEKITESGLQNSSAKFVPKESVLIAMYGATVGRVGYLKIDSTTNQAACALVVDPEITNPKWLYYSILATRDSLIDKANGAAQQNISVSIVRNHQIKYVPLEEQERIAGILGSLDDKIEANTRLIQTLLDTADSIFQKFYSECELSESTYASLEVYGGGTPSTKNETYWGGDIHWLTPTDVTSLGSPMLFDTARKLTEDGLNACSSKLHPAGSIMMTSRATIGAFAINQYPAATNQGFIVAVPHREEERWWIYHHMKKDVPEMINSANGTTFLEISRRTFKGLPYGSLSDENLDRFHAVVNPLYELVKSSEQENLQLAETRDALIKRLIG